MALSPETVASLATEYQEAQPLAAIEAEHREMLPETFASGEYGWRDAEWVVQWYFRRFLGAYPDAERRAAEDAFGENNYEAVHAAISGAVAAEDVETKLDMLTDLRGIDSSIASAFLQFAEPSSYLVVSEAEWTALAAADELDGRYPDPPSVDDYEEYLTACRSIAERSEEELQTVYRALWMLGRTDG